MICRVLAYQAGFVGRVGAVGDDLADHFLPVLGGDPVLGRDVLDLFHELGRRVVSQNPGEGGIGAEDAPVGGGLVDALDGVLEDAAVLALGPADGGQVPFDLAAHLVEGVDQRLEFGMGARP